MTNPELTHGRMRIFALAGVLVALAACGSGSDSAVPTAPGGSTPGGGTPSTPVAPVAPLLPITGLAVPTMASVDNAISAVMAKWEIPGGAVGIMYENRLVYARGFGYSDVGTQTKATPQALFRIASLTKPITKAAILKLVEQGRLTLDARAFSLMPDLTPLPGAAVDPRLPTITVQNLLDHAGGWDAEATFEPMLLSVEIAAATGTPAPASVESIIRFMMGKPLSFTPGTKSEYCNFCYAVLGRIIERVSGQSYEQFVKENVLGPAGVTRMKLGHSLYADRLPDEVHYYDQLIVPSVFPGVPSGPIPYGGFNLEAMDSMGGWVASVSDLLRFERMWIAPPAQGVWSHGGGLPGTSAVMARSSNGVAWVALFNARDMVPNSKFKDEFHVALEKAVDEVTSWPTHDLFSSFP